MAETDASVSGFSEISGYKYDGFNEHVMSELEQILMKFTGLPKTQSLIRFYDSVQHHLFEDPTAHGFSIVPFAEQLVQQLYQVYLNHGYTGSVKDMLFSFTKSMEVATHTDVISSWNREKALTLAEWNYLFQEHDSDPEAHPDLYELFNQKAPVNLEPNFYFSYFVTDNSSLLSNDGYTLTSWNTHQGTLYAELRYDVATGEVDQKYIEVKDTNKSIVIGVKVVSGTAYTYVKTPTKELLMKAPFKNKGLDRVVLTYDASTITARNLLETKSTKNNITAFAPIVMRTYVPMENGDTCLHEISYYPKTISSSEQLFFLN